MTTSTSTDDPVMLVSSKDAAKMIGIKPQTLRLWRYAGRGPRFVRLGENRYCQTAYRVSDIEAWIEAHSYSTTAEETVKGPNRRSTRRRPTMVRQQPNVTDADKKKPRKPE